MVRRLLNDRISKVRKTLGLTQQEFAERIGMKRNSIAAIEIGHNTSDRTIIAICREFNVEETWLRTGEGEMFCLTENSPSKALDQKYNLSDFTSLTGKDIANSKLGMILRHLRMENGYTQQDVADILGIKNKSTLGSWEIGKSEPDIFTFLRLCLIYHVADIYKTFLNAYSSEESSIPICPQPDHTTGNNINMHKLLIKRLKEARNNKGLKQADVAEMLGVKKNTISNWENDKADPDIDSLIRLCTIYGISCSKLLDDAYGDSSAQTLFLSDIEQRIILAYRHSDRLTKELVHRALNIDVSQTDPGIETRQGEMSQTSGDTGVGEERRGA